MIFDAIFGAVAAVLTGLLSLLPEWTLPESLHTFGAVIGGHLSWANGYFPVVHLGICVGIYVGARLAFAVFGVLRFLYDRVPLKFT